MEASDNCTGRNPWPTWVSFATTSSALPAVVLGYRSLWRGRRSKLPLWGGLWLVLATLSRRFICARCPYYGEYCSTLFGKVTPLIWRRDQRPLTAGGFLWDLVLAPALFILPAPDAYRISKRYLLAYLSAWALFLVIMHRLGCRRCPLDMCPFNPSRPRGMGVERGDARGAAARRPAA